METKKARNSLVLLPSGQLVPMSHGQTVLDALLAAKIEIDHSCGGMGSCGTCRIFVENLPLSQVPRNELEAEIAIDRQLKDYERLSCQLQAIDGMKIKLRE